MPPHENLFGVTGADADAVLAADKVIGGVVRWRKSSVTRPNWELDAPVLLLNSRELLQLVGFSGLKSWGFSLLYRRVPIRRTGHHAGRHRHPDGTYADDHHKHMWDEIHLDHRTYIPTDIDFTNINQAFFDFLKECGIRFEGTYQGLSRL